jgi:hypothetical protein
MMALTGVEFHEPGCACPSKKSAMTDTFRIMCPNLKCRSVLAVPEAARGRMVRCKQCGSNIRIPEKKSTGSGGSAAASGGDGKGEGKKAA